MAKKTSETIGIHDDSHGDGHHSASIVAPDVTLAILTWVTFFIVLAILQKYAWKPILSALDKRESDIKQSIEDADKIKAEMERLEETTKQMIAEAEDKAKQIIEQSRNAASEAAKAIQSKARDEASILMENARRDIREEKEKAISELKEESANIAVELAGKLIEENLDDSKNRKLVNQFIKEI